MSNIWQAMHAYLQYLLNHTAMLRKPSWSDWGLQKSNADQALCESELDLSFVVAVYTRMCPSKCFTFQSHGHHWETRGF